ncbi:tetratricopeptide repeat protein [Rhodoflexus sp.]
MRTHLLALVSMLYLLATIATAQSNKNLSKGNNAYEAKQYENAVKYYTNYLKTNQGAVFILFRRGECLLHLGRNNEAISDLTEVIRLQPRHQQASYMRGIAYQRLNNLAAAILDFERHVTITEKDIDKVSALRRISECYEKLGEPLRARAKALLADQYEAESAANQGKKTQQAAPAINGGRNQQVTEAPNILSDLSPDMRMLSRARSFAEDGDYATAETLLTQFINSSKDNKKEALDLRGQVRSAQKKYKEAIEDFQASLRIAANDAWTYNQMGLAYMHIQQFDAAATAFKQALNINPTFSLAGYNLEETIRRQAASSTANDRTGPQITITSPHVIEVSKNAQEPTRGLSLVSVTGNHILVTGIAEDPSGVREVQLNGLTAELTQSDPTGRRFTFTINLPVGQLGGEENMIYLAAKDRQNNTTTKQYKYKATSQLTAVDDRIAARQLLGKTYVLLIGIDEYIHWDNLSNAVRDVSTIGSVLKEQYGAEVEILANPKTKEEIERKIREYANKDYAPNDQLMVFIAAHGYFIEHISQGFIIPYQGLPVGNERNGNSWLSHNFIRQTLDASKCKHIFLIMDACYSGTFSPLIARSRGAESAISKSELVAKKIQLTTRKFLTSGGKERVPDGEPGRHSPFAGALIDLLKSRGEMTGGIITINDMRRAVQNLKPVPQSSSFPSSNDHLESDFFLIPLVR